MHRKTRSLLLPVTFGLLFSVPFLGCSSGGSTSSSSGGTGSGGISSGGGSSGAGGSGNGGTAAKGGNTGTGNGGSAVGGSAAKGGSTGTGNGGSAVGGSGNGGSNNGGNNNGGNGGAAGNGPGGSGAGGSNNGGSNAGGSNAGGSSAGGTGAGGVGAGGNSSCTADPTVISNFESTPGQADMNSGGTPARSGWWYVYYPGSPSAMVGGGTQTPAPNNAGPIATAAAPDASTCNSYALHSTGSGFATAPNNYVGFGAGFSPKDKTNQNWNAYDASKFTGVKFRMKAGSGTQQAVYFELLTQDTVSSAQGGLLGAEGGPDAPVGLHNNRGQMLNDPWTPGGITSTYQTITVPFGTLVPRWVPAAGTATNACPTSGTPKCQAPVFNPAHVLGIQVSIYQDPGFPKPTGSTAGTYDLWIDDVAFTTDDSGLQDTNGLPPDQRRRCW